MPLRGSLAIPRDGPDVVGPGAQAALVHLPGAELRLGMATLGGPEVSRQRLGVFAGCKGAVGRLEIGGHIDGLRRRGSRGGGS